MHVATLHGKSLTFLAFISLTTFAGIAALENDARADANNESNKNESSNKVVLAADANLAISAAPHLISTGIGFAGRLGYRLRAPLIAFTPEIGVGYHTFDGDPSSTGILRGFGGARLAIGEIVKPSIFAHIGYADVTGGVRYAGPTYDVGAALDFTALPIIDFGIHADYASVVSSNDGVGSASWIDLGAHVALYF